MTKRKTHFTRKNYIFLSLLFFYLLMVLASGFLADANNSVMSNSPLRKMIFGFLRIPNVAVAYEGWLVLGFFAIYAFLFAGAFLFEMRLAKFYEKKVFTSKWSTIYGTTFAGGALLWIGLSLLSHVGAGMDALSNSFLFFGESLLIGTILFAVLALPILFLCMMIVNFRNIDKPFRFNKGEEDEDIDDERPESNPAPAPLGEGSSLAAALGTGGSALQSLTDSLDEKENGSSEVEMGSKEYVFPGLCTIDEVEEARTPLRQEETTLSLREISEEFRLYLAKNEGLFFSIETIRAFLSGMAASRLLILEGLSGTGKSSLARYFSEFIGEESFFEPVQASWRDRSSLLGFFNDFSRKYNETDFLKRLYQMTYRKDDINIMVLDEINISRVEYYFADFLSILEYPIDKWKLRILQVPYDFEGPQHLDNGVLTIPENTWFIGTANKDDSTYTITDKVYDRAITLSFDDRNEPFEVERDVAPIHLTYSGLNALFGQALAAEGNRLTREDFARFVRLTSFVAETFDITFGNRVLNQMEIFSAVYVACGGRKEEALDFLFARKVLYKLEGRFEDYVRQGLLDLLDLIDDVYGKESFSLTRHTVERLIKRL